MANYNVVTNKSGGWDAKRDNAQRLSFHAKTQREAESVAKRFSKNSGGGEVRIQGCDGKFRDSDTIPPGNDPNPPKDRKH
ncbi:DUF2188 domain-containing protein [Patescibacteria group bacterium]|nr:DUF2188 domain-containing protein [Patescibacteria group bacterium]MBU1256440.1 DUF2188 domain-containing protein [Patescibacteria group bacterium]MBU1457752.1 DUF2188 domain-containing protein [Patescibacteria group bacterium]